MRMIFSASFSRKSHQNKKSSQEWLF